MLRVSYYHLPRPSVAIFSLAILMAAGCVADDGPSGRGASATVIDLSFDCGDGESLHLAGDGATLLATDSHETRIRLEASPADQRSRYDADGHALVLNEREALWMKPGTPPMTCRR